MSKVDEASGTTVIGVLSNEPYEERGEAPIGLKRDSTEIIALWTKDSKPYETTGADVNSLFSCCGQPRADR